jgi:predicted small metal-binding protein
MSKIYSYSCKDYPGMESCPGHVVASTEEEVCKLMELHAEIAHGEDPSKFSDEDWKYLKTLIKQE